jgi:hypothetical protein
MQTDPSRLVQTTAAQKRVKGITLPLCGDAEDLRSNTGLSYGLHCLYGIICHTSYTE